MALIKCPECGKEFSDRAQACPNCACPIEYALNHSTDAAPCSDLIIANTAFIDGRYEEAYNSYVALYSKDTKNVNIMLKLALSVAAKDYFRYGIPNSTKELVKTGLKLLRDDSKEISEYCEKIAPFLDDAEKVLNDTLAAISSGALERLEHTECTRSAGDITFDALFTPVIAAHRNFYEDEKTARQNTKIIDLVVKDLDDANSIVVEFKSFILRAIVDSFDEGEYAPESFANRLNSYLVKPEDSEYIDRIMENEDEAKCGLCSGPETVLVEENNTLAWYYENGVIKNGFSPSGKIIITNYSITYDSQKSRQSFKMPLNNLVSISRGGVGNAFIDFKFINKQVRYAPKSYNPEKLTGALRLILGK